MDVVPGEMGWCARATSRKLSLRHSLHLSNILFASRVGDSLFDVVSRWPWHMTAELDSSKLPGQLYQPRRRFRGKQKENKREEREKEKKRKMKRREKSRQGSS